MLAWGTPEFESVLKQEIGQLKAGQLPLQQGLSTTSYATDSPFEAVILGASEVDGVIRAKAGIFYQGIIAGCSCADDPTPVNEENEYCELLFEINRKTGKATVALLG